MLAPARAKLGAAIVVASLALNVVFVSCAADSTAPQSAAPDQSAAILARLDAISARLDSMQTAMAKQSDTVTSRLTQLAAAIGSAGSVSGTSGTRASGLGSQIDSLLALASYIADNAYTPSTQFCVGVSLGANGAFGMKSAVDGKASADLGAWAGTGAFAGGEVKTQGELGGSLGVGLAGSVSQCTSAGSVPPSRNAQADLAATPVKTAIASLRDRLNWGGDPLSGPTTRLASLGTGGPPQLRDVVSAIPIPSALQSAFNDPTGYVATQLPDKISTAVSNLCTRSWNSAAVSNGITYACGQISSGSTDIGGMFGMLNDFPAVQTAANLATTAISGICTRINTLGATSLTIPNPLNIGPSPFYSARLFPGYSSPPGC